MLSINDVARTCHAVNRAYCESLGDFSQPTWEAAPAWQQQSTVNGVVHALANPLATPEQSHENWLKEKAEAGWTYGETKNPELKQHPCFRPYVELPIAQKAKDHLFLAVVNSLRTVVTE